MNQERKWAHWERLVYVGLFVAVMIWVQIQFGASVAAMVLGSIGAIALFGLGSLFTQWLNKSALQNAADLLHEMGGAQASGHRALQDMYRTEREHAKLVGRGLQLEARQTDTEAAPVASWEVLARQENGARESGYGPVYVDQ